MSKLNAVVLIGVFFLPVEVSGQIPPGYHVVQITDNDYFEYNPRINNRGQIVFMARLSDDRESEEIFLYDKGKLTRLTNDNIRDAFPAINDDGTIVWSRAIGPMGQYGPKTEIVIYKDGRLTRLTDNDAYDFTGDLNNLGHIAWKRYMGDGCGGQDMDIFFYDGREIRQISKDGVRDGVVNQAVNLNDDDQLVWTRYNFCENPWTSMVQLYSDGKITRLSDKEMSAPQSADINAQAQVTWNYHDLDTDEHRIVMWESGETSFVTLGRGPRVNDRADVYFNLWDTDKRAWQTYMYRAGKVWQLSNDPVHNVGGDLNDLGEAVWEYRGFPVSDIRYLRRFSTGDLNCDGSIDLLDVEPFISALIDACEYAKRYPTCDALLGDLNSDGSVDLLDVEPFIELLIR